MIHWATLQKVMAQVPTDLETKANELNLRGLLILGHEGFNSTLAAPSEIAMTEFKTWIKDYFQIADLMFVFDNLKDVDDRGIQAVLREVSSEMLIIALKGADEDLQEKIFGNMSKRAAELMRDDLEAKGPVKVSEVEAAQKEILTICRRMADAGQINLGGGGEAML